MGIMFSDKLKLIQDGRHATLIIIIGPMIVAKQEEQAKWKSVNKLLWIKGGRLVEKIDSGRNTATNGKPTGQQMGDCNFK